MCAETIIYKAAFQDYEFWDTHAVDAEAANYLWEYVVTRATVILENERQRKQADLDGAKNRFFG
jgi:hypothetical protein